MSKHGFATVVISESRMHRFGMDEYGLPVSREEADRAYKEFITNQLKMNQCSKVVGRTFADARKEWHIKMERMSKAQIDAKALMAREAARMAAAEAEVKVAKKKTSKKKVSKKVPDAKSPDKSTDSGDAI